MALRAIKFKTINIVVPPIKFSRQFHKINIPNRLLPAQIHPINDRDSLAHNLEKCGTGL